MISRYVAVLHFTWLVNSAAHMFGMKPYDKNIGPAENRSNPLFNSCPIPKLNLSFLQSRARG